MNNDRTAPPGADQHRSLQILDELANNDSLTQRDLSGKLGIALGLVNSYIKNLVAKGYITVKAIPRNGTRIISRPRDSPRRPALPTIFSMTTPGSTARRERT